MTAGVFTAAVKIHEVYKGKVRERKDEGDGSEETNGAESRRTKTGGAESRRTKTGGSETYRTGTERPEGIYHRFADEAIYYLLQTLCGDSGEGSGLCGTDYGLRTGAAHDHALYYQHGDE